MPSATPMIASVYYEYNHGHSSNVNRSTLFVFTPFKNPTSCRAEIIARGRTESIFAASTRAPGKMNYAQLLIFEYITPQCASHMKVTSGNRMPI